MDNLELTPDECAAIVAAHREGEQMRDAAEKELEAVRDKLEQISCLAFDDGRLNRKLLCSLVDEMEQLMRHFELPHVVECDQAVQDVAYDYELRQQYMQRQYNEWLQRRVAA